MQRSKTKNYGLTNLTFNAILFRPKAWNWLALGNAWQRPNRIAALKNNLIAKDPTQQNYDLNNLAFNAMLFRPKAWNWLAQGSALGIAKDGFAV